MITKTKPRPWTKQDIADLNDLKKKNIHTKTIAYILDRSEVAVQIKWKRLNKTNNTYNEKHIKEKYRTNEDFLEIIKPKTVLDLYAGEKSFYLTQGGMMIITNDIEKEYYNSYRNDALKTLCLLYYQNEKFDLVDLDPFGSAYDCFDLAIKTAKKGLIITYGELGHKRWKRLDYVERYYNIQTLEDFNLENLIKETQAIGIRNKKKLSPIFIKKWQNIARVYYKIEKYKVDVWG
tara:strand:+ start:1414 stop:2115 length:702 start_codon:yes stop_codon:yes gene_type:complete